MLYHIFDIIYNSLFNSKYNCCFLVWGNTTGPNIKLMHTLKQKKKAVRIIRNTASDTRTGPSFNKLNIVQIPNQYYYYKLFSH